MKLLLISAGRGRENSLGNAGLENLGIGYLASYMKMMGWPITDVVDLAFDPLTDEELIERQKTEEYIAIGISGMTWCAPEMIEIARALRLADPDVVLVAGGVAPTSMPDYFAEDFNYVITGEGEKALHKALYPFTTRDRPVLTNGNIIRATRDCSWDGRAYPYHDRSLVERNKLHMRGTWPRLRSEQAPCSILGARGCLGKCSFCMSEAMWGREVVVRRPEEVVSEIEYMSKQGYLDFDFTDLNLNRDADWLIQLCKEVIRRQLHKKVMLGGLWNPALCVDRTEEVIAACAEAGFVMLSIGLENPDPGIRDTLGKMKMGAEHCHRVFAECLKKGITTRCLIILGSPGQDEKNLELIEQELGVIKACEVRTSMHTIFPGTRDWERYQHLLITRNWRLFDTAHQVLRSRLGDVEAIRLDFMRRFYDGEAYRCNRTSLIDKKPEFETGYRQLESGFLRQYKLIDDMHCL